METVGRLEGLEFKLREIQRGGGRLAGGSGWVGRICRMFNLTKVLSSFGLGS